jgi:hypothetical protein
MTLGENVAQVLDVGKKFAAGLEPKLQLTEIPQRPGIEKLQVAQRPDRSLFIITPNGVANIAVGNKTPLGADTQPLDGMTHLANQDDDACCAKGS